MMQKVYAKYCTSIEKMYGKYISFIKLLAYFSNNLMKVLNASSANLKQQLVKNCCYEQRNDRVNMAQFIYAI